MSSFYKIQVTLKCFFHISHFTHHSAVTFRIFHSTFYQWPSLVVFWHVQICHCDPSWYSRTQLVDLYMIRLWCSRQNCCSMLSGLWLLNYNLLVGPIIWRISRRRTISNCTFIIATCCQLSSTNVDASQSAEVDNSCYSWRSTDDLIASLSHWASTFVYSACEAARRVDNKVDGHGKLWRSGKQLKYTQSTHCNQYHFQHFS